MMMNNKDKKSGMVAMIVKKIGGKDEMKPKATNEAGDELDYEEGEKAAANNILNGIKNNDVNQLKEGLKNFIDICISKAEQEEDEDDGEESESETETEND